MALGGGGASTAGMDSRVRSAARRAGGPAARELALAPDMRAAAALAA
jgi:hypothetical protein